MSSEVHSDAGDLLFAGPRERLTAEVGKGDTWEEAFASIEAAFVPRREAAGRAS